MSYGVTPIAVDLDVVRAALGSGDHALLSAVSHELRRRIDDLDRADDADAEDEDRAIPAAVALRQMILGEPLSTSSVDSAKYGYMFEGVSQHFGEGLPNSEWSGMGGDWFDSVDAALGAAGVAADRFRVVGSVFYRGMPVAIPAPDDFPAVGYVLRSEMPRVLAALRGIDLPDPEVGAAVEQIRSWLETCAGSGRDLVCFYY